MSRKAGLRGGSAASLCKLRTSGGKLLPGRTGTSQPHLLLGGGKVYVGTQTQLTVFGALPWAWAWAAYMPS